MGRMRCSSTAMMDCSGTTKSTRTVAWVADQPGDGYTSVWSSITAIQLDVQVEHVSDCSSAQITNINWDAPANDNFNPNGDWVDTLNPLGEVMDFTGCRLHDSGADHTYYFKNGFRLAVGNSLRLYTGKATCTCLVLTPSSTS